MHNPANPDEFVKEECLVSLGLSATEGAKVLGETRHTLSNLVNGHAGVSSEMTFRLEKAFGSTAEAWLGMQMNLDIVLECQATAG